VPRASPAATGRPAAARCPPGLVEGATRQVVAWRLDRERLTALTAAVAPGIPVVNTDLAAQGPAMEGPAIDGAAIEGQDLG
jgi:hypothetical protein